MPRKSARKSKPKQTHKRVKKAFLVLLTVTVLLVVVILIKFIFTRSMWISGDRLTMLSQNSDGSATITVYEPQSGLIYNMEIPSDVQLQSAKQLGVWRLGSLWQLASDEHLSGELVAHSITMSMGLPIDTWKGLGTNINLKDRIKIKYFGLKTSKSQRINVDPVDYGFIYKTRLLDGDDGYIISDTIPVQISRLFSSEAVFSERARMGIQTYGEFGPTVNKISRVIEVLGTKVVSVESLDEDVDYDCEMEYKKDKARQTAQKLSLIFACKLSKNEPAGNIDLLMKFGNQFNKRF